MYVTHSKDYFTQRRHPLEFRVFTIGENIIDILVSRWRRFE